MKYNRYALAALLGSVSLASAFADEQQQGNSVQLRKIVPNGGNINNGPETVPVVTIVTDAGPVRINASEYDPATHTLAEGEVAPAVAQAPATPPAPPAPAAPAAPVEPPVAVPTDPNAPPAPPSAPTPVVPVEKFVTKTNKKWFVTDKDGKPLDAAHEGYATEAEAQAAAKA